MMYRPLPYTVVNEWHAVLMMALNIMLAALAYIGIKLGQLIYGYLA